jgi:type I restriction-modification system DNA methylase subunit
LAKTKGKIEFGDFQTPLALALEVVSILEINNFKTIIEPTCGLGRFFLCL